MLRVCFDWVWGRVVRGLVLGSCSEVHGCRVGDVLVGVQIVEAGIHWNL